MRREKIIRHNAKQLIGYVSWKTIFYSVYWNSGDQPAVHFPLNQNTRASRIVRSFSATATASAQLLLNQAIRKCVVGEHL